MQLTLHKLDNPTDGASTDCLCGAHFDAVTLDAWRAHVRRDGAWIAPVTPSGQGITR